MIRFLADIIYLFFFLTLTAPLYPLFEHWNKTDRAHKRSAMAQRMVMNAFRICLRFAGTKLIVEGKENIPRDTAVLFYMWETTAATTIFYADTVQLHPEPDFLPKRKWRKSPV